MTILKYIIKDNLGEPEIIDDFLYMGENLYNVVHIDKFRIIDEGQKYKFKVNSNLYEGYINELLQPNGMGELYNKKNILIYEGQFNEGKFNGNGKLYDKYGKLTYEGEFSSNLPDGIGTKYYYDELGIFIMEYKGFFIKGNPDLQLTLDNKQKIDSSNPVLPENFSNNKKTSQVIDDLILKEKQCCKCQIM